MSALDDGAIAPLRLTESRLLGFAAGFALAAAAGFLAHEAAPGAPAIVSAGFAGLSGSAALALAFTLDDAAVAKLTKALAASVGLIVLGALAEQETRLRFASSLPLRSAAGSPYRSPARRGGASAFHGPWRRCSRSRSRCFPPTRPFSCSPRAI